MLRSVRQVNEEFFKTFYGITIPNGDSTQKVKCIYAKKSSVDYSELDANQIYPCIAIQDYPPSIKENWYVDLHTYFGGLSADELKGYLIRRPIWMQFRYDVSIAALKYSDYMSLQDYFMQNFVGEKRFIFNKQLSGDDTVGDIVPYDVRLTEIPRTDGVQEMNYEFTLSAWLHLHQPKEIEVVQKVILSAEPQEIISERFQIHLDL